MKNQKTQSPRNIVSPRQGKQHDSVAPIMPDDPGFDEALCQVVESVKMAEMGRWPAEYLAIGNPSELGGELPVLLKDKLYIYGSNAARNLAMSVSMDRYWDLGVFLLAELQARGVEWKNHKPDTIQFCDTDAGEMVFMKDLHNRIAAAMDKTFDVKFYWEKMRPEDYLEVPGPVFCIDRIGAPGHWSFWAGHATAAATTYAVLMDHLKLVGDLAIQVLHECWMFAFGRTVLGVHWIEDNVGGFMSGLKF